MNQEKIKSKKLTVLKEFRMNKVANSIFKVATPVILISALLGCASPAEQQAYVSRMGDQELCMSWMTSATMNQYQRAREGEVRRRGLNCYQYGNVAAERRKAENRLNEQIRCAAGCQPQRTIVQPQEVIYERPARMGPGVIIPGPTPYGR
jgi:hypothetical protein